MLKVKAIALIILVFCISSMPAMATKRESVEWVEAHYSTEGTQWWDRHSLTNIENGIIRIRSKFISTTNNEDGTTIYFVMDIDCSRELFKDVYINGFQNLRASWKSSKEDQLVESVVNQACLTKFI